MLCSNELKRKKYRDDLKRRRLYNYEDTWQSEWKTKNRRNTQQIFVLILLFLFYMSMIGT